ncbi:MAG: 4-hydroxythreonine-4-phosphate dehydrogenase PdxA [Betaproteobacteria bacterium]
MKPTIALFTGDPAGIGPELVARLLADGKAQRDADILLIGAREVVEDGMRAAGVEFAYARGPAVRGPAPARLVDWDRVGETGFVRGEVAQKNGEYMLAGLALALDLSRRGIADAICFAPLNKAALRAGGMRHADELHYFCEVLGFTGACVEFNVLDTLWTSRVTSHVPLKDVSELITREGVADGVALLTRGLQVAGNTSPRIAVCGLNPHNGDNGAFGTEEIDTIIPGVELARSRGFPADGPFPADTAFVRAIRKDGQGYDGVLTMYHDQGQIAMKLMGFDRGVTVPGGLPIPIATPAHGTAYDIAGRGIANTGAMTNAFALACRMGATHQATRAPA